MNLSSRLLALSAAALLSSAMTSASAADLKVPAQFSTIQGAVDAASPGDKIRLAKGLYNEDVVLENKLLITLKGGDDVLVKSIRIRTSTLISIKEIAFTGAVGAGTFGSAQLAIENSQEIDVRFCGFSGQTFGVGALDSDAVAIRDSSCEGMSTGVFLEGTTAATVRGMKFVDCSQSGLGADGAAGLLFADCVSIDANAPLIGVDGATVTDNVFKRSVFTIIDSEGCLVESNRFKKAPKGALVLEFASGNLVRGNKAKGTVASGIAILEGSDGNLIQDNKVKGSTAFGIGVLGHGNLIEGNVVKKNDVADLADFSSEDGTPNQFVNNKFTTSIL